MDRRNVAFIVLAVGLATMAGCAGLLGLDEVTFSAAADASSQEAGELGDSARGDAAATSDATNADSGAPDLDAMIRSERHPFLIDRTEVTQAQYLSFLLAKVDPSSQPAACAWNDDFAVRADCSFSPTTAGVEKPVTGVDWCDAYAYCAWAGKHLCGKTAAGWNEWDEACTNDHDGLHQYAYGPTVNASACNFVEIDAGGLVSVGSLRSCQGGLPGLYDMLGNAGELTDECTYPLDAAVDAADTNDMCRFRGATFTNSAQAPPVDCTWGGSYGRRLQDCTIGFRCCATP